MQWSTAGGFSDGEPWLPMTNPERLNVESQRNDERSLLHLYRRLLTLRSTLSGGMTKIAADGNLLTFQRGGHTVAVNFGDEPCKLPDMSRVIFSTAGDHGDAIAPLAGVIGVS
jgi:alpha-glucosidase